MEQPRLATPAEKSWMDDVSCKPVKRRSLSLPKYFLEHFSFLSMQQKNEKINHVSKDGHPIATFPITLTVIMYIKNLTILIKITLSFKYYIKNTSML